MELGGLFARKSWFFFDDEAVCLGAGISSAKSDTVVTTMNQCFLTGDVTVSRAGKRTTVPKGARGLEGVEWVYHDGVAYLFPGRANVRLSNGPQSGSWWDINHTHSKDVVTKDVFTLWIDHGTSPSDASYAYIVAPTLAPGDVGKYAAEPRVDILSNASGVQAVRHRALKVTGNAFYEPGRLTLGEKLAVEADKPLPASRARAAGGLEVSASNPANEGMRLTSGGGSRRSGIVLGGGI